MMLNAQINVIYSSRQLLDYLSILSYGQSAHQSLLFLNMIHLLVLSSLSSNWRQNPCRHPVKVAAVRNRYQPF